MSLKKYYNESKVYIELVFTDWGMKFILRTAKKKQRNREIHFGCKNGWAVAHQEHKKRVTVDKAKSTTS